MEAPDILQSYLDEVGNSVMSDDWQGYQPCVHLACELVSYDGSHFITTEAELRDGFEKFRDMLRFYRVTDFIRLTEEAVLAEDVIADSYVSHLISTGHRLLEPFRPQITLCYIEGRWHGTSVTNGLSSSRWATMLSPSPEFDPKGPMQ